MWRYFREYCFRVVVFRLWCLLRMASVRRGNNYWRQVLLWVLLYERELAVRGWRRVVAFAEFLMQALHGELF